MDNNVGVVDALMLQSTHHRETIDQLLEKLRFSLIDESDICIRPDFLHRPFQGLSTSATHTLLADWDRERSVWNGFIKKNPILIVNAKKLSDVQGTIKACGEMKLSLSVKGGGHNVGGLAVVENGVVLNLSHLRIVMPACLSELPHHEVNCARPP